MGKDIRGDRWQGIRDSLLWAGTLRELEGRGIMGTCGYLWVLVGKDIRGDCARVRKRSGISDKLENL